MILLLAHFGVEQILNILEMEDSIIDTFLKEDIQSFQVDNKRKLIGAAVSGKGT